MRHDTHFRSPCGRKFRSFPEVARFLLQGGAPSGRSNGTDVRGRGKRPSGWEAANAAGDRSDAPPVATTARPAAAALSYPTPRPSLNPCPNPDRS